MNTNDWIKLALVIVVAVIGAIHEYIKNNQAKMEALKAKNEKAYNLISMIDQITYGLVQQYAGQNISNEAKALNVDSDTKAILENQGIKVTPEIEKVIASQRDKNVNVMNIRNGITNTEYAENQKLEPADQEKPIG